jgi:hypothetical protein
LVPGARIIRVAAAGDEKRRDDESKRRIRKAYDRHAIHYSMLRAIRVAPTKWSNERSGKATARALL